MSLVEQKEIESFEGHLLSEVECKVGNKCGGLLTETLHLRRGGVK